MPRTNSFHSALSKKKLVPFSPAKFFSLPSLACAHHAVILSRSPVGRGVVAIGVGGRSSQINRCGGRIDRRGDQIYGPLEAGSAIGDSGASGGCGVSLETFGVEHRPPGLDRRAALKD